MAVQGARARTVVVHQPAAEVVHATVHPRLRRRRAAALDPPFAQQRHHALGAHGLARSGSSAHQEEERDLLEGLELRNKHKQPLSSAHVV